LLFSELEVTQIKNYLTVVTDLALMVGVVGFLITSVGLIGCIGVIRLNETMLKLVLHFILVYHIISYHIISYHIISYHIISYHIISYHIISYHIISYHIILVCLLVVYPRVTSPSGVLGSFRSDRSRKYPTVYAVVQLSYRWHSAGIPLAYRWHTAGIPLLTSFP